MPLIKNRYGKGRVRVMRIHRDGDRHEVSQLNIKAMVEGDFARDLYPCRQLQHGLDRHHQERRQCGRARKHRAQPGRILPGAGEEVSRHLSAGRFRRDYLARDQVGEVEFRWQAASAQFRARQQRQADRGSHREPRRRINAGLRHRRFCLHEVDPVRLGELRQGPLHHDSRDRRPHVRDQHGGVLEMVGQACELSRDKCQRSWRHVLEVFSTTYSKSVQDSLYRMGEAALAAVPEISEISMACPNMHFIPMNLSAFGLDNNNDVFLPTDEPHGQIECTVGGDRRHSASASPDHSAHAQRNERLLCAVPHDDACIAARDV